MTIMNTGDDVKAILKAFIKMLSHIEKEECFSFTVEYIPDGFISAFEMKEVDIKNESENATSKRSLRSAKS